MPATKVAFRTIGCRTNQQEIGALQADLQQHGFRIVDSVRDADIAVVNSCCVTAAAEAKTRRLVAGIARAAPQVRIALVGCVAQRAPDIAQRYPSVAWVVGNSHKGDLARVLSGQGGTFWGPPNAVPRAGEAHGDLPAFRTRSLVKIQEGCDYRCAYCVVPFVRGRSRSVPLRDVLGACEAAVGAGAKEIVLTGTHIGQYQGEDGVGLAHLVERMAAIDGDFRIRLGSLDPRDLSDRLVDLICRSPRVCRHLHLSVQSLSAPILCAMRRPQTAVAGLVARLALIRTAAPQVAFGGDFIVGFPGESDAMFVETLEGVGAAGFSYGHVFRYSMRPSTEAANMPDQIPEEVKIERAGRLQQRFAELSAAFVQRSEGRCGRIVVEQTTPCASGVTSNFLHVRVNGVRCERNKWLDVVIVKGSGDLRRASEGRIATLDEARRIQILDGVYSPNGTQAER